MAKLPPFPNLNRHIRAYPLDSAQTFKDGAAVLINTADGEVEECGADPATILGFALHPAGELPHTNRVLVAVARDDTTFMMQGTSDPVQTDEGKKYGITKDGDGIWLVDKTDAVNTRVVVEKVYPDQLPPLFEVKVLAANRQL